MPSFRTEVAFGPHGHDAVLIGAAVNLWADDRAASLLRARFVFVALGERRELVRAWAERLRNELERLVGARDGELEPVWTSGRDLCTDLFARSWKRALRDLDEGALALGSQ